MNTTFDSTTVYEEAWKKAASTASNEDVEKQFLDVAYGTLQNKLTPVMKAPYRIGFEIVHKNDEGTRLVGIFIFRVNKELFYAPVFFINGVLKGTDLFYRHEVKRFVPATQEWVEYLISLAEKGEGKGVPQSERQMTRHQMDLYRVIAPPNYNTFSGKFASAPKLPDAAGMGVDRAELVKQCAEAGIIPGARPDSLLRKFIEEDGGFAASTLIRKAAGANLNFARALMLGSKPENYMPEKPAVKRAGRKPAPEPQIIFRGCVLRNPQVKRASLTPQTMSQGYLIEDLRKEAGAIYADGNAELSTTTGPGVFNVLMVDGGRHDMIVGHEEDMLHGDPSVNGLFTNPAPRTDDNWAVVDLETKNSKCVYGEQPAIWGTFVKAIKESDALKDAPEKGKAWRIVHLPGGTLSRPFKVQDVTTNDAGLKEVWIATYGDQAEAKPLLVNPDFDDVDYNSRVYGNCCKFIEVATCDCNGQKEFSTDVQLGDRLTLNKFIFENGFKSAAISFQHDQFVVEQTDGVTGKQARSQGMGDLSTKLYLMVRHNCNEATATDVVKQARDNAGKPFNFLYEPDQVKQGYNLQFNDWPDFYQTMNNEYGVLEEPENRWLKQVQRDEPDIIPSRVGDVWRQDQDVENQDLSTATPTQLFEMSKNRGMDSLFETGVVGELIKTYDSVALTEKYLPDLEVGLDRLGRILFLFYWKPADFAEAYGADDQNQLESQLINNFKSLGELVLELKQKSNEKPQPGSASLA